MLQFYTIVSGLAFPPSLCPSHSLTKQSEGLWLIGPLPVAVGTLSKALAPGFTTGYSQPPPCMFCNVLSLF